MFDSVVDHCNAFAGTWAGWMGTSLLGAAIVLAVVSLVWLVVRRHAPPQLGYLLFLLVPLKLFVPLEVTLPERMVSWMPAATQNMVDPPAATSPLPLGAGPSQPPVAANWPPAPAAQPDDDAALPATPAPPVSQHPDVRHSALSPMAYLALFWVLGVVVLLIRAVCAQFQFVGRVMRKASPMNPASVSADYAGLLRRVGLGPRVRIAESDRIASPVVWGIFRPTLILPTALTAALSASQLEWVLLHELAHVRRRDLIVNCFQRVAAILHFVNPAIWIANRMIDRFREFACDDMAMVLARGSQLESGEAFLGVMRYAASVQHRTGTSLNAAVGVFESVSRSSCAERMSRLLDTNRRVSVRLGLGSLCVVLLTAVLALPQIRAANHEPAGAQAGSTDAGEQPTTVAQAAAGTKGSNQNGDATATAIDEPAIGATVEGQRFELTVLGPGEKPVPQAAVEIRGSKRLAAEQIQTGRFIKTGNYAPDTCWTSAQTDADGRLVFQVPKDVNRLGVAINQPGYGPYQAWFGSQNHPWTIPSRLVAVLEGAWSLGGVLVDPQGNPIQGAKVNVLTKFKMPPSVEGRTYRTTLTKLTTDAKGQWRCDSVPVSMDEVLVVITHPGFQPLQRSLTRAGFGIPRGAQPAANIELPRGITVVGKVTDEAGNPISGATLRTKLLNGFDGREAKTNEHGQYQLIGCAPQTTKIVVAAKGRAIDMREVAIGDGMQPVNFAMKPGGKVRVRVQDEKGNPAPKADVYIQQWRDEYQIFALVNAPRKADDNGVWVWDEAPPDEFKVDIGRPGGMALRLRPLVARDEEYVFRCPPALEISGSVIDAATKEPVKAFRVVPGFRYETNLFWHKEDSYMATDGRYRRRDNFDALAHLIRIEADGYLVATSRDIRSDEGKVRVDFELQKGKDVSAIMLTPNGQPAAGAKIAIGFADSEIDIHNGKIRDDFSSGVRREADAQGRFSFPNQNGPFQAVITHPSGFAHLKSAERKVPDKIPLAAWARVEGTFRVGSQIVANVPITITTAGIRADGGSAPRISTWYETPTGSDGRFVFDRVFPGVAIISRRFMIPAEGGDQDVTSSCAMLVKLAASQTARVDIGGSGRPVIGKLAPPPGRKEKVLWNYATIHVRSDLPPLNPPMPRGLTTDEQRPWRATDGGRIWQAASDAYEGLRSRTPQFAASVAADGSFRIDDVPAGTYTMSVHFVAPETGDLPHYRFTVPPIDGGRSSQPLEITLEKKPGPRAADAPRFRSGATPGPLPP